MRDPGQHIDSTRWCENMGVRVLLVEDHDLVRFATRHALEDVGGWVVIGDTGDGQRAIEMVKESRPHLVLLDLSIRGIHGIEVLRAIKRVTPEVKVLVVTAYGSAHLAKETMDAGADGYVLKDAPWEDFLSSMQQVMAGNRYIQESVSKKLGLVDRPTEALSCRERQILGLIASGLTNKEAADQLHIQVRTIEFHVSNSIANLGASNRTEAASLARDKGLID